MLQHGGHEVYTVKSLVEDYSVTTNFMGPCELGILNMQNNLSSINHYPPTDKNYFSKGLTFLNTKDPVSVSLSIPRPKSSPIFKAPVLAGLLS